MEKILGIVYAYDVKDAWQELLDLGFSWVRMGICFPWKDKMYGTLSGHYMECKHQMEKAHRTGLKIMVVTPGMGCYSYDEKKDKTHFTEEWPVFIGEKGSEEYYKNVTDTCEFICKDLGDIADGLWQCMNEIDIPTFSGHYGVEIITATARAQAEGIVRADPEAKCGINLSRYHGDGLKVADMVYAPGHKFSYIGDDQYFGSWQGKTVESWNQVIDLLYERYHLPVLANEWGYSSGGKVKDQRTDPALLPEGIPDVCYEKSWFHDVPGGHNERTQAEYLRRGLQIFAENSHSMGGFLFCYKDAAHCYHCGEADCPSECFWGIVDVNNQPKESYEVVRQAIIDFFR